MTELIDDWFNPEDTLEKNYFRYSSGHPNYGVQDDFELQMRKFKVHRRLIILSISLVEQSGNALESALKKYDLPDFEVLYDPYFKKLFSTGKSYRYLIKFKKKVPDNYFRQMCEELGVIDDS